MRELPNLYRINQIKEYLREAQPGGYFPTTGIYLALWSKLSSKHLTYESDDISRLLELQIPDILAEECLQNREEWITAISEVYNEMEQLRMKRLEEQTGLSEGEKEKRSDHEFIF